MEVKNNSDNIRDSLFSDSGYIFHVDELKNADDTRMMIEIYREYPQNEWIHSGLEFTKSRHDKLINYNFSEVTNRSHFVNALRYCNFHTIVIAEITEQE